MDTQKLNAELDAKIPRDAVATRQGGGSKALSYLETHYVIDRMNKVFGNLGWSSETTEMRLVEANGKPAYVAKVRIAVHNENGMAIVVKEGYGYGIDKSAMNPHEMAIKEAESDAFKRAAKNLGQSMGLALYDKSQENIEENAPRASDTSVQKREVPSMGKDRNPAPARARVSSDADIDAELSSLARVAIAKKKTSLDDLKARIKGMCGSEDKANLAQAQKEELRAELRGMIQ